MGDFMNGVSYVALFIQGTAVTFASWIVAGSISLLLGVLFGTAGCRYLASRPTMFMIKIYTFIAKGIPAYVQILIAYFVLPSLFGINISGFVAASIALAFCSSGYMTEIFRSGMNAVPSGQWDACAVLGYPFAATMRRIILPQTIQNVFPAIVGELEQLLKSTSLLAAIGVTELTRTGMNVISRELNPIQIYVTIAVIYLCLTAFLQLLTMFFSGRLKYD